MEDASSIPQFYYFFQPIPGRAKNLSHKVHFTLISLFLGGKECITEGILQFILQFPHKV